MDSVQYNTEHCVINDDMDDEHSILGVAETACQVGVLCADSMNSYVHVRVVVLQRSTYRNFQKCKF